MICGIDRIVKIIRFKISYIILSADIPWFAVLQLVYLVKDTKEKIGLGA